MSVTTTSQKLWKRSKAFEPRRAWHKELNVTFPREDIGKEIHVTNSGKVKNGDVAIVKANSLASIQLKT